MLFGGTFDPVHHGHVIVARAVAEQGGYQRVILVPAARPPHKRQPEAPAADRLAMLELAVEGESLFDICRLELERPGPSYTYDTLCRLREQHGRKTELHLLIGADMLEEFPTWHRAQEVLETTELVVAARPGWEGRLAPVLEGLGRKLGKEKAEKTRRSILSTPLIDISSTEIRRRVRRGLSIRYLTPYPVVDYIKSQRLYAGSVPCGG